MWLDFSAFWVEHGLGAGQDAAAGAVVIELGLAKVA